MKMIHFCRGPIKFSFHTFVQEHYIKGCSLVRDEMYKLLKSHSWALHINLSESEKVITSRAQEESLDDKDESRKHGNV